MWFTILWVKSWVRIIFILLSFLLWDCCPKVILHRYTKSNRNHLPAAVKNKKLDKRETITQYSESVMVGKWHDKQTVLYISNEYENVVVTYVNPRTHKDVMKPITIVKYNAFMKGIDRSCQPLSNYTCECKTLWRYKNIFTHTIQMLVKSQLR